MRSVIRQITSKVFSSLSSEQVESPSFAQEASDPHWYRAAVGGMWEEIGRRQFDFMVEQGLEPRHYLLDIGCGSLRGGLHFIRYLDLEHYFGVDISQDLLDAGKLELQQNDLVSKSPTLVRMGDFEFSSLDRMFGYALAQSVFTHLPLNSIIRCVVNLDKVLVPGGRFYATFFENPKGKFNLKPVGRPYLDGKEIATYFDEDPYHYDFGTFEWVCEGTGLTVEYIGPWEHPWDQRMLVFLKRD
jgi:cyclopropane fatty-acyl-phospholipid synthase-like methyltransferase